MNCQTFLTLSTSCMFFQCWVLVYILATLGIGCTFSRALHRLLVSRVWHRLRVFLRLAPVVCFPALGTGCVFSRAWPQMRAFPSLAPIASFPPLAVTASFPALGTDCKFFSRLPPQVSHPWHWLHVFQRTPPISCFPHLAEAIFPVLGTNRMFPTRATVV